jgi:hypothetical protein
MLKRKRTCQSKPFGVEQIVRSLEEQHARRALKEVHRRMLKTSKDNHEASPRRNANDKYVLMRGDIFVKPGKPPPPTTCPPPNESLSDM